MLKLLLEFFCELPFPREIRELIEKEMVGVVIGGRFQTVEPVSADLPPRPAVLVDKKVTSGGEGDGDGSTDLPYYL